MKYWTLPKIKDNNDINLYRHCILLDGGNKEGLLKPLQKAAEPTDEVAEWLNENIGENEWMNTHGTLSFKTRIAAMAFMLKWS